MSTIPWSELETLAVAALSRSYSPYSKVKVGSAVLMESGKIYTGANIENSSYGGTVCAERVAIWTAIHQKNEAIVAIVVVTNHSPPWPPCGLCRQVMAEFAKINTQIKLSNLAGEHSIHSFSELMPFAFLPEHLKTQSEQG